MQWQLAAEQRCKADVILRSGDRLSGTVSSADDKLRLSAGVGLSLVSSSAKSRA